MKFASSQQVASIKVVSIVIINLSRRAHDHNWELDPITRSLLDTDFYKLLMLQFIWKNFPKVHTTFTLLNRSTTVRLAEVIQLEDPMREPVERRRAIALSQIRAYLAGG